MAARPDPQTANIMRMNEMLRGMTSANGVTTLVIKDDTPAAIARDLRAIADRIDALATGARR